ncbi:GTPase [Pseudanabaena sp. PCC 6802]|uniref:GTPase family protein n=1 Tax=Pseudanabaena sp. PCC 6802 TaxID=118173 RepID=UPI000344D121
MGFNPFEQVSQFFKDRFWVSDEKLAEILASVRDSLSTIEVVLVGKTQSGKSSIIRGLTGVSADIVGQGFRPHTQHTQRYDYPSSDLPILTFIDTVGLGDADRNTQKIIEELCTDLEQSPRARVLILTVKITDFANDALLQVIKGLRQRFPAIPCILAVTCLHLLYPPNADRAEYPPASEPIARAFAALKKDFGSTKKERVLYDRAVLIDFTLEEDGFDPVFYGLDALRDAIADLLPEAEAKMLRELVDREQNLQKQLGHLYKGVALRYLSTYAVLAATIAAVPLPFATMPVLTATQVSMVVLLGNLYGQTLSPSQAGGLIASIGGGFVAQTLGRELIKFVPGFGSVVAASWAAAYTWALGEAACFYFGELMQGKKPNLERVNDVMKEAFRTKQEQYKKSNLSPSIAQVEKA